MPVPPDLIKRAEKISEELHGIAPDLVLGGAGMLPPPWGTAADVASFGRDFSKAWSGTGSWWDVTFSGVGFIPIFGDAAKGGRIVLKLGGLADEAAKVASELAQHGDEGLAALGKLGDALGSVKPGCDTLGIKQICATLSKIDEAKKGSGVKGSGSGRTGKQERLRELADDPNLGTSDRGWIKQEMNSIERGQRTSIRNPPGKDLAHERGREAAKGYSYKHSHLQNRADHQIQHKYDNYGRGNKERPPADGVK